MPTAADRRILRGNSSACPFGFALQQRKILVFDL